MFHHEKRLMFPVQVQSPNPSYAGMVLEQFGGANGELKACIQYVTQSFGITDPAVRDLLLDIATEEISHLEMVGTAVTQFLTVPAQGTPDGSGYPSMSAEGASLMNATATAQRMVILGGGGPLVAGASGSPFSGDYVNATGDIVADLHSNVAAELRAKRVYEMLHREVADPGARQMFDFLIEREEAHASLFLEAIDRVRDMGVMRRFGDTEFSNRYPELSQPGPGAQTFDLPGNFPPITAPVPPQQAGHQLQPQMRVPNPVG